MSLYADYVKERLGWRVIEIEAGFICYDIRPPLASVEEIYIRPDQRGKGFASRLADKVVEIAKEEGAHTLFASIIPGVNGAEHSLMTQLKYGFKLHSINADGKLLLALDLEGR